MGEIREKIVLANAVGDAQARIGQLPRSQVRRVEVEGVVDTGTVRSVLPLQIVTQLGLGIRGQRIAQYADGRSESVDVTEPVIFECQSRDTVEEALVLGNEVLIGQTVLEKLDLLADCNGRRLVAHPVRRETAGWKWPIFMLLYMNALAYIVSLAIFQVASLIWRA
jgi:predicted aspartyl protease